MLDNKFKVTLHFVHRIHVHKCIYNVVLYTVLLYIFTFKTTLTHFWDGKGFNFSDMGFFIFLSKYTGKDVKFASINVYLD